MDLDSTGGAVGADETTAVSDFVACVEFCGLGGLCDTSGTL